MPELGIGKEDLTLFQNVLMFGCKYKRNGCTWKEFLLETKTLSNS